MLTLDKNANTKTLGIIWDTINDSIKYVTSNDFKKTNVTKRTILSATASMFDPIGLIGPVTVSAKIILQRLWQLQLDWDESVPMDIHQQWIEFKQNIPLLQQLMIPRFTMHPEHDNNNSIELHGFCDASTKAYGACVYVRTKQRDNSYVVNLLCAKNKVAPTKMTTIPRLELCASLLLTRLMKRIANSLQTPIITKFYWTDSTIVLAWLRTTVRTLNVFVHNRIVEIQEDTILKQWRHVPTESNPADVLSRGTTPLELAKNTLWWNGPNWLRLYEMEWPVSHSTIQEDVPEIRTTKVLIATATHMPQILERFSNINKLIRVIAWCFRFLRILRKGKYETGPLSTEEISASTSSIIRMVQREAFSKEYNCMETGQQLDRRSHLLSLSPLLDKKGIIRVGGRLSKAELPYNQKHQIILPRNHHITKLIIRAAHRSLLHGGTQIIQSSLRGRYWILGGRSTIKNVLRQCICCFKVKPKQYEHVMGNLPQDRVRPTRPFTNCGLDFAGPIHIKEGGRRSKKMVKVYISVFVCFATRAIHLEIVADLTSKACIAALRRFMSRRGKVETFWSDNATNFTGANNELKVLHKLLNNQNKDNPIAAEFSQNGINWRFIPARSPHFRGLWEAAVKSVKGHLRKVVGNAVLTYEELHTFLVQVEGILNSRPLTPITDDPEDQEVLTPAHFLIGAPLNEVPQPSLIHLMDNRLSRWEYIQKLREHFWSRWSKEYLNECQRKSKWKKNSTNKIKIGQLVLIQEDGLHPLQWLTGRIVDLHPGGDGVIRVASVRLPSRNIVKRASRKLCVLPID